MKFAYLFKDTDIPIRVSAQEVKEGKYDKKSEFIDAICKEFRVQFVRGARNNGGPYFRLYYSYEDFKKLHPDRADRYQILANMWHFAESEWHRKWKENMSEFCNIEKYIKNNDTGKWKFADAFYEKTNTCIEFQHSYISSDFEKRNNFYSELKIKTVWLYNLPTAETRESDYGIIELLENNAKGFFRISENPDNLKNNRVYIQVKSGMIYRVKELFRRHSHTNYQSTIRYFVPTEVYTEEEFIKALKHNTIGTYECGKTLKELWSSDYSWMIVRNIENNNAICINRNHRGEMFRDFDTDCIKYVYMDNKCGKFSAKRKNIHLAMRTKIAQFGCLLLQTDAQPTKKIGLIPSKSG